MMPLTTVIWLVIATFIGQGVLVGAVLYVVRSFGVYTNVVLQTHQQNMLIQQENFNLSDDLCRLRAQLLAERTTHWHQPPQSEEVVA
jgi:hypothetical protein